MPTSREHFEPISPVNSASRSESHTRRGPQYTPQTRDRTTRQTAVHGPAAAGGIPGNDPTCALGRDPDRENLPAQAVRHDPTVQRQGARPSGIRVADVRDRRSRKPQRKKSHSEASTQATHTVLLNRAEPHKPMPSRRPQPISGWYQVVTRSSASGTPRCSPSTGAREIRVNRLVAHRGYVGRQPVERASSSRAVSRSEARTRISRGPA